jgi:ParB-like chromosome segregation protein Spo0J
VSSANSLETRELSSIVPWDKNPRKNAKAVDYVLESLNRHGQVRPLVLSAKGRPFEQEVLCCGHTTLLALKRYGAKEAKVVIKEFADEAQFADYAIRDNKTSEHAEWDEAMLAELAGSFEIDLAEMGFEFPEPQEDIVPESSSEEIDVDGMEMAHKCPRCGFEFDKGGAPDDEA